MKFFASGTWAKLGSDVDCRLDESFVSRDDRDCWKNLIISSPMHERPTSSLKSLKSRLFITLNDLPRIELRKMFAILDGDYFKHSK